MFIGHWSAAFVAATHPKAPRLPVLFIAAQFIDWLFFLFVLFGFEKMRIVNGLTQVSPLDLYYMPWTHSMVGAIFWAAVFGGGVWLWSKNRIAGLIAGAVVFSHWLLDLLVHQPDLTLAGGEAKFGLGLWNHAAIEMPLELGITALAIWIYARGSRAIGKAWAIWMLVAVLAAMQMFNWFSPAPAEMSAAIPISGLLAYAVATACAWWADRNRAMTRKLA